MRSALIVGAGGQDGRLLTNLLLGRGYTVRGWVRSQASGTHLECECAAVNLLESSLVEAELRRTPPDEVYYLAAFHHSAEDAVDLSAADLLRSSFDVHVLGLLNVLQAMEECCPQTRLFYAASSHIFGESKSEWQDENTPFSPTSPYGISKTAGVRCCQFYRRQKGVFAATGILFNHESSFRKSTFLSQKIVRGALEAQHNTTHRLVLGCLDARVDWGYAPDYVDAMSRILQLPEGNDFVIASGETHTVGEFAQEAFAALDLDWRRHVTTDSRLMNKIPHPLRGNFARLKAATGWAPTVSFKEMVSKLVRDSEKNCEFA